MKQSVKRIVNRTADDVSIFFPYFFVFYIIIVFLSYFFISVGNFFYWPGLNASILFLAVISSVSSRGRRLFSVIKRYAKEPFQGISRKMADRMLLASEFIFSWAKKMVLFLFHKFKTLPWTGKLKIILIILIGILSLILKISTIDSLVLIYGLILVFFGLWPKSSFIFALILIILCPIVLILELDSMAKSLVVHAYYFLIIAVIVSIRELISQRKLNA